MDFRNHLFSLNEVVNQQTMEDLGRMWFKHHDRDPYKRFQHTAERQSAEINQETLPIRRKAIAKRKLFTRSMEDAPEGAYRFGGPKTTEYYKKALDHLSGNITPYDIPYSEKVSRYAAHKKGWEEYSGIDRSQHDASYDNKMALAIRKGWPSHKDISSGVGTMHQRAGEKSMSAMNRLTNYMDKNGINQENPTMKDKQNYQNWLQRTNGRFVKM